MNPAVRGMMLAIRWYQRRISPLFGPCCKYYPSCSRYAMTAIQQFGAIRGTILAILRLMRCRPWSRGGIDDVPQRFSIFYRFRWSKAHEEPRLTPLGYETDSGPVVEPDRTPATILTGQSDNKSDIPHAATPSSSQRSQRSIDPIVPKPEEAIP
ncbi:cytosolic protein [Bifidobacterium callimiconis]|uniref:Putative membrane protein insertion efficiency factor n=1 Tax=Bifidobacterium callimiconis TaxID=2306973 RepID=A0A430FBG9_9BIFI|nr:cytosolic protein [Bifidobacterium callimiconis]